MDIRKSKSVMNPSGENTHIEKNRRKGVFMAFKKGDYVRWKYHQSLIGTIEETFSAREKERIFSLEKNTPTYIIRLSNGTTFRAESSEIEPIRGCGRS
jgi:hypothetical protein